MAKKEKRPELVWNDVLDIELSGLDGVTVSLCHRVPEGGLNGTSEPRGIAIFSKHREDSIFIDVDVWPLIKRSIEENWKQ